MKTLIRQLLEWAGVEDESWLKRCLALPSGAEAQGTDEESDGNPGGRKTPGNSCQCHPGWVPQQAHQGTQQSYADLPVKQSQWSFAFWF